MTSPAVLVWLAAWHMLRLAVTAKVTVGVRVCSLEMIEDKARALAPRVCPGSSGQRLLRQLRLHTDSITPLNVRMNLMDAVGVIPARTGSRSCFSERIFTTQCVMNNLFSFIENQQLGAFICNNLEEPDGKINIIYNSNSWFTVVTVTCCFSTYSVLLGKLFTVHYFLPLIQLWVWGT